MNLLVQGGPSMTRMITAFLAVALLILTGCGASAPKSDPSRMTATVSDQGIELTASIASPKFAPHALPQVDVTVRNNGKTSVRYIRYNGCDTGVGVIMQQGDAKTAYFDEKTEAPVACTEAITMADLAPGATIQASYVTLPVADMPPPDNGDHVISISFNRATSLDEVKPVVASLQVTVEGGKARVTEAEAVAAAKADARVVQWLKAHPDALVVGRWHQGRWLVRFASKSGTAPHEVEVAVAGVPAKVESVAWR
jgi:hypothetical protein